MSKKETIAILTNFMEFSPGYSLTGIVADQVKMFQAHGHPVHLYVNSQFNLLKNNPSQFTHNVTKDLPEIKICPDIPFAHLIDYASISDVTEEHKKIIQKTKEILVKQLKDVKIVLTHDFIFTGWFLLYGLACMEASKELPDTTFYHWIHSTPSSNRDWWNFNVWGGHHKLIFPNETEKVRVAEQYKTMPNNVACIPHIKDLRTWGDFGTDSNDFIDDFPAVMNADVVQIYPASSDRFSAKRLDIVMEIFSHFKKMGYSVCLVIANQWATGRQRKEDVGAYIKLGESLGLVNDKDFIFTSEWPGREYATGIPKSMLRDLASLSNLFIFPTREESFGLVNIEIPLSTACITVTNRSLNMSKEVNFGLTEEFEFGSFHHGFTAENPKAYYKDVALLINNEFRLNKVVLHRTMMRKKYNFDFLYTHKYRPVMGIPNCV